MSDEDQHKRASPNRVLTRLVTFEPDGVRPSPTAVCPRRLSVVRVAECGTCKDFVDLSVNPSPGAPFMRCAFEGARTIHGEAAGDAPYSEHAFARDAMSLPPSCATLDMTLAHVMRDLLADAEAVPVIDEDRCALGVITRVDVLQRLHSAQRSVREPKRRTAWRQQLADGVSFKDALYVRDMRLARSFMVSPDASLARVAAVMAYERVQHVLVVAADGKLLGLVSALDVARWVARRAGYVVPARERG